MEKIKEEHIDKYLRYSQQELVKGNPDEDNISECHRARCRFYEKGGFFGEIYAKCTECGKKCKTVYVKPSITVSQLVEYYENKLKYLTSQKGEK